MRLPSPGDATGNAVRGTVFCQPTVDLPLLHIACPLHTAGFTVRQESLTILSGGVLGGSLPYSKALLQQSPASQARLQALCNARILQQSGTLRSPCSWQTSQSLRGLLPSFTATHVPSSL